MPNARPHCRTIEVMTSVEEMQGRDGSLCASSSYYMQTSLGTRGLEQEHKSERKLLALCQSSSYSGVHRIRCARNSFSPQQKLVITSHFTHSTGEVYSGSTQAISLFSPGLPPSWSWMCIPSSEVPKVSVEKRQFNWGQHS